VLYVGAYEVLYDSSFYTPTRCRPRESLWARWRSRPASTETSICRPPPSLARCCSTATRCQTTSPPPTGQLRFRRVDTGDVVWFFLLESDSALYDGTLYKGAYVIELDAVHYPTVVLPAQVVTVGQLSLTEDTTHDIDMETATISGEVTENGAMLADDGGGYDRGELVFRRPDTYDDYRVSLDSSGPAAFGRCCSWANTRSSSTPTTP